MNVSYGPGEFREGQKHFQGEIILSEHKLCLKGPSGEWSQTFIPLEKIVRLKKGAGQAQITVRLSQTEQYGVVLSGERKQITALVMEIVDRRGLKKRFIVKEWIDPSP